MKRGKPRSPVVRQVCHDQEIVLLPLRLYATKRGERVRSLAVR
jgi:hypothetical protein